MLKTAFWKILEPYLKYFGIYLEKMFLLCFWNVSIWCRIIDCVQNWSMYIYTKKFLAKLYVPKQIVPTALIRELLLVLPFFGKFSLNLRCLYNWLANHYHKQCNILSNWVKKSHWKTWGNSWPFKNNKLSYFIWKINFW